MWEDWLRKVPEEPRGPSVRRGGAGGEARDARIPRPAAAGRDTLLELTPQTGRMHQLRVQAAWRGHPVLGDVLYGSTRPFGPPAELPRDRVIALHARSLTLTHPFTKEELTWSPPPSYWPAVDERLAATRSPRSGLTKLRPTRRNPHPESPSGAGGAVWWCGFGLFVLAQLPPRWRSGFARAQGEPRCQ